MKYFSGDKIARPAADMGQALRFREVCLLPPQFLGQQLLLGHIYPCPHEPLESQPFRHRYTHATQITSLSIWPHNPLRKVESAMVGQHLLNFLFHELPIFWVYKLQIAFYRWRFATRIQAVNLEQFGRPIFESSSVECPATHMSEALPFAEIKLGSLQGFLCPLPVGDVLHRAEHLIGPARRVSLQIALAVHRAHFSAGTNDPVFSVGTHSPENGLLRYPEDGLSIFRVDHFAYCRQVYRTFLRHEPIDAVSFVRPSYAIGIEVPYPVADMGDALGFFKPGFAF